MGWGAVGCGEGSKLEGIGWVGWGGIGGMGGLKSAFIQRTSENSSSSTNE